MKKILKQFNRLSKKQRRIFVQVSAMTALSAFFFGLGGAVQNIRLNNHQPQNIVWAVDDTVKIPADLKKALMGQNSCQRYRGIDSPRGVGLWGVTQVEHARYAKIAYGCSWTLTSYIVAVKENKNWHLIKPVDYFANTAGGVPSCSIVNKYKIPASLETFCTNDHGQITKNPNQ